MDEQLDRISAFEALTILKPHFGGSAMTKAMLADEMRDNQLRCFARKTWFSEAGGAGAAWREGPVGEVKRDVELKASIWRKSLRWSADQTRWRWEAGRFSITRGIKKPRRHMLEKVQFLRLEIEALKGVAPPSPRAGIGGRSPKFEARNRVWLAAMTLMDDGSLSSIPSKTALIDALLTATGEELSEKPVREIANLIADKFCHNIR